MPVETRIVHDPFLNKDVQVSDRLTDRLRGRYACGPVMPNGEPEFGWREFETPPIQHEAATRIASDAKRIAELEAEVKDLDRKYNLTMASRLEWRRQAETAERALAEERERHQWRTIDSAPKDRVIFVRRDNGCGTDYEIVWWSDEGDKEDYPWKSEFNAYPVDRWDEWMPPPS